MVPASVFNCPATEGTQEPWVQMAMYGGVFVFAVLADVLEAKNLRECEGKADVSEEAEEACAAVAATVTSVSAAAIGVGEESEDENEMGQEEQQLGTMMSAGVTDQGD